MSEETENKSAVEYRKKLFPGVDFADNIELSPQNKIKVAEFRSYIAEVSVALEFGTAVYLCFLLGIKDKTESLSFGTTSQALGFNQKINLLLDTASFDSNYKDVRTKYSIFMEIRNLALHNYEVMGIVDAFEKCTKAKWFQKNYIDNNEELQRTELTEANKLMRGFKNLSNELIDITNSVGGKLGELQEMNLRNLLAPILLEQLDNKVAEQKTKLASLKSNNPDKKFSIDEVAELFAEEVLNIAKESLEVLKKKVEENPDFGFIRLGKHPDKIK